MSGRTVLSVVVVVAIAAFLSGLLVGWTTDPSGEPPTAGATVTDEPTGSPSPAPREQRSRAERLLAQHSCWTGDIPAGRAAPTHAVVTLPGQRAELVDADVGFAIWLDGAPGILHGFCP